MMGEENDRDGYRSPAGSHRHQCYDCGWIWEHSDSCHDDFEAHLCPQCGQMETFKYTGRLAPSK